MHLDNILYYRLKKHKNNRVKTAKLEQHAKQHAINVQKVNEWHDLYQDVFHELKQIIKPTVPYSHETHQFHLNGN